LLLDHGHPEASSYPLGRVYDEAEMIIERLNVTTVTTFLAFRTAYISARAEPAQAQKIMGDFIERLLPGA
jgi:hypothetical protein